MLKLTFRILRVWVFTLFAFSVTFIPTVCAAPISVTQMTSAGLSGKPIQQIAITTSDLPKAIIYYRDTLGLPFLFESNGMAFFDMAGIRLMIAYDADRPTSSPTSIIYFEVDDFNEAVKRLRNVKVTLDGPVETVQSTPAGDLKIQQFHDFDGNALALIGLVSI
ncbi:MAG: VOC family protein [Hellea sp.]